MKGIVTSGYLKNPKPPGPKPPNHWLMGRRLGITTPQEAYDIMIFGYTLRKINIAMENGPFEDLSPIENGDNPLLR